MDVLIWLLDHNHLRRYCDAKSCAGGLEVVNSDFLLCMLQPLGEHGCDRISTCGRNFSAPRLKRTVTRRSDSKWQTRGQLNTQC